MKLAAGSQVLVVALVLAGLAPGPAAAKRGYFVIDPSSSTQVQLRASNGYVISLSGGDGFVSLAAQGHHAAVQYFAEGTASKGRIKARFGSLGRVALRFHPRGKARLLKEPEGNCSGGDSLVQSGVFVGKLDFEGEQGYTGVHASRVKGTVTRTKKQVCKEDGSEEGISLPFKMTILSAAAESGTTFYASRVESKSKPGRSGTGFSATVTEFQSGFSVSRSIQVTAKDATAFSFITSHGHITEATVTPPAPFSGSATYRRAVAKKSETWVGSLAGDFPGLGTVSLAGPEFCAEGVTLKGCNGPAGGLAGLFG